MSFPLEPAPSSLQTEATKLAHERPPASIPSRLWWAARTFWWGALLALGLGVLLQRSILYSQGSSDFCQDYIAAVRVLQGMSPYLPLRSWPDFHTCTVPLNYDSHPPFTVLLVLPLGLLPRVAALTSWAFVSLAAYLLSGALLLRALRWWSLRSAALFVVGSLFWQPYNGAMQAQNFAELLTVLLVVAWLAERSGRLGWAGVVLGMAGLIKIWPLALLLIPLVRRQRRFVLSGVLTFLIGTLTTLLAFGPGAYAAYLGPVRLEELAEVPHEVNITIEGAVSRLWTGFNDPSSFVFFPPLLSGLHLPEAVVVGEVIAGLLLLGTLAFVVWANWRAQGERVALLSQGLLVTVLLLSFPITWHWGLITLLLPFATTALALRQAPRPARWWYILLWLSLALLIRPEYLPFILAAPFAHWGGLIFALPTAAILLFTLCQAHLLFWATTRHHTSSANQELVPTP